MPSRLRSASERRCASASASSTSNPLPRDSATAAPSMSTPYASTPRSFNSASTYPRPLPRSSTRPPRDADDRADVAPAAARVVFQVGVEDVRERVQRVGEIVCQDGRAAREGPVEGGLNTRVESPRFTALADACADLVHEGVDVDT